MYQNVNLVRRDRLDLYNTRDASHPFNTFYEPATIVFLGPVDLKNRKCTDIVWVIGLILATLLVLGMTSEIYSKIGFEQFYHGNDFRGDLCGKEQLKDKKYLYFFDPEKVVGIGMCVDQCPSQDNEDYCFYDTDGLTILVDYCYKTYQSQVYLDRYCMPLTMNQNRKNIEKVIKSYYFIWTQVAHDIYGAKDIIGAGYIASIVFGFIYMVTLLIKKVNMVLVWVYAFMTPVSFVLIFMWLFQKEYDRSVEQNCLSGQDKAVCLGERYYLMEAIRYLFISATGIYVIILLINRKKIIETGRDIQVLLAPFRFTDTLKFAPFLACSLQFGAIGIVYTCIVVVMASGKRTRLTSPTDFPNPEYQDLYIKPYVFNIIPCLVIILIIFLQTMYVFQKFCYAFAVQVWYFARQKSILDRPSARGIIYCFWKHMGTCVKGAIISLVNWSMRSIMRLFKSALLQLKDDNRDSKWLSFWLCCCVPYLNFYEYWSKYQCNLTIMHTSLYGDNWADGAEKSHYLFSRNLSRTQRFENLYGYHRIIGMVLSSSLLYLFIYNFTVDSTKNLFGEYMDQAFFPWASAFSCFLFGLYLPQNFTMSFDAVIEGMLFCLVADEEMFMGRERFCEDFILDYLNSITKETIKKGLITVARKDQQDNKLDDYENLENLKPKEEVKPPKPPTPPVIEPESSSSSEEDNAVDLFAARDRLEEQDRNAKFTESPESSDSEPQQTEVKPPPSPPKEETFQFQKIDLNEIKDEQKDSDVEDDVQEDFGMNVASKKKNVQVDDDEDDDIILDYNTPRKGEQDDKPK